MVPRKSDPLHEDSWIACIPGTVFFGMIIFGAIVYVATTSWLALFAALAGALLIWIFYW